MLNSRNASSRRGPRGQALHRALSSARGGERESARKWTFACSSIFTGSPWKQHLCKENRPADSRGWPPLPTFPKGPEKKNSFSGNDGIHKYQLENRDLTCARESIAICCLTNLKERLLSAPQWQTGEAGSVGGQGAAERRGTTREKITSRLNSSHSHSSPLPPPPLPPAAASLDLITSCELQPWDVVSKSSGLSVTPHGSDLRYTGDRRFLRLPRHFCRWP